jgi:hypothetical protein
MPVTTVPWGTTYCLPSEKKLKIKIKLNVGNLFQNIWILSLSLDKQNVIYSFQKHIQHLKIRKYYIK